MKIASAKNFGNTPYATNADIQNAVSQHVSDSIHVPSGGTSGYYLKTKGNGAVEWAAVQTPIQSLDDLDANAAAKLSSIESSAQKNQLAIKTINVKSTAASNNTSNINATTTTDTISFVGGDNVTLTTNGKVITFNAVDTTYPVASSNKDGLLDSATWIKISGIATGAQANQNAFKTIAVSNGTTSTNVVANATEATVVLVAGSNITLTGDNSNRKITISANNTTYGNATTASAGLMTAAMVSKLEGIAEGATNVTSATVGTTWGYTRITSANVSTIASTVASAVAADKITNVYRYKNSVNTYANLPTSNQSVGDVYNIVSADATHNIKAGENVAWNGTSWDPLGGSVDLSNYPTKETVSTMISNASITIDTAISANQTNAVQGGAIYTQLSSKFDKVTGKGLSTKDFTAEYETKLTNISAGAEVNQNAVQTIAIKHTANGTATNLTATIKSDTITIIAGSNVSLVTGTKTVTINASNTTYGNATTASAGLMTAAMVSKLEGITAGAEPNKYSFKTVAVSSGTALTNIVADTTEDTLTLVAGTNITLTPDADNDKITIAAKTVTVSNAVAANGTTPVAGSAIYSHVASQVADRVKYEDIAQVGFTGDYNDLVNTPTIPSGSALLPPSQRIQFTSANGTNATWSSNDLTITHTVNCIPNVVIYDNDMEISYPTIRYINNSTIKILFDNKNVVVGTWTCIVTYGHRI